MINIQSTLRTAPDLCKMFHCCVKSVATVIHTQSVRCQMCIYVYTHSHILHNTDRAVGRAKQNWDSSKCRVPRKSFRLPFWARVPQVHQKRYREGKKKKKEEHFIYVFQYNSLTHSQLLRYHCRHSTTTVIAVGTQAGDHGRLPSEMQLPIFTSRHTQLRLCAYDA